jgi:hypothetical protein
LAGKWSEGAWNSPANILEFKHVPLFIWLPVLISVNYKQCCGSGCRNRCFFERWIRDGEKIRIRIPENKETIFWVKTTLILWCGSGSGIQDLVDCGSWMEKCGFRIRNKQLDPNTDYKQCGGSGSEIWCILTPGSRSGISIRSRIQDPIFLRP